MGISYNYMMIALQEILKEKIIVLNETKKIYLK